MLFGEAVAVYCENHMEHTNALCDHKAVFFYAETFSTSITAARNMFKE
jgi:hypothetical protein